MNKKSEEKLKEDIKKIDKIKEIIQSNLTIAIAYYNIATTIKNNKKLTKKLNRSHEVRFFNYIMNAILDGVILKLCQIYDKSKQKEQLKKVFDPKGILNPEKIWP